VMEAALVSPDACVVVHCTHGVNRTGYFIVRYLLDTHQVLTLANAIAMFETARGCTVDKDYLLKELSVLYDHD